MKKARRRLGCACCFGIILIGLVLFGVYYMTGKTPLDFWSPKRKADNSDCLGNMRQLSEAMKMYMESADAYPPSGQWMDELARYVKAGDMEESEAWKRFHCPAVSDGTGDSFGYAMNGALSSKLRPLQKNKKEWDAAKSTMVLFDATDLSKNANGNPKKLLPAPGRHSGKNNILFGDGHVASE